MNVSFTFSVYSSVTHKLLDIFFFSENLVLIFCYISYRLLNCLKPGSIKRINKLPGAIAGLVSSLLYKGSNPSWF